MRTLMVLLAFVIVGVIHPVPSARAQSKGTQSPPSVSEEDGQLRDLEARVQTLRAKLYAQRKLTKKWRAEWYKNYRAARRRLERWNKFADEYEIAE